MRNFTLSLLASMLSIVTWAQVLKVESVEKLPVPRSSATAQVAAISQAGDYLLLCSQAQEGLVKWDLSRDTGNMLTTARGAGFNTQISDDGDIVAFVSSSLGLDIQHVGFVWKPVGAKMPRLLHASAVKGKVVVSDLSLQDYAVEANNCRGIRIVRLNVK